MLLPLATNIPLLKVQLINLTLSIGDVTLTLSLKNTLVIIESSEPSSNKVSNHIFPSIPVILVVFVTIGLPLVDSIS